MKTHRARTFLRAGALLAVVVIEGNLAQAQTCTATWTGTARNGSWSTPGNWSPRKVPGGRRLHPDLHDGQTGRRLTVQPGLSIRFR